MNDLPEAERKARKAAYMREWRRRRKAVDPTFKDYYRPDYEREWRMQKRYGLTGTAWQQMFDDQEGLCALCREKPATCIDHCHTTDRVRALLCNTCNAGLGQFQDRPELLAAAIEYLRRHA